MQAAKTRETNRMCRKSSCRGRCSSPRSNSAESAGESVSALKAEMAIENAIVRENCRYKMPVVPGKKLTGTNTAMSTSEVAMTALVTSFIAREVAAWGSLCSSWMWRCTFSITTIASSTTKPVANVMPNSVSELMEKLKSLMNANVPISETGIVTAGMMVARQSSRNRKMTVMTMKTAIASVDNTSRIESPTTVVESNATAYFRPGGKDWLNATRSALTFLATSSAFAVESCITPMPCAPWPRYSSVEL